MGSLAETNPSLWVATAPPDVEYPAAPGGVEADVVVVGAGIAGLSAALALAEQGASVVVLEAGRVASGVTGYTTAKVTSLHGLVYSGLVRNRGRSAAQAYAAANEAGVQRVRDWVERYGIACELETRAAVTYTTSPSAVADIEAEVEAAQSCGLAASFVAGTGPSDGADELGLPFAVAGAVRLEDQAQFHPRRYCSALAAAIASIDGCALYEQTRVVDVDGHVVRTSSGDEVRARSAVVLATHLPFLDRGGFFAKTHPERSYAMAVRLRAGAPMPPHMYLSTGEGSTRSLRSAAAAAGELLIVGGEGHKVGQEPDTRRCYDALDAWAREQFDVEAVEHRWSAQDYVSVDGTPFVGRQLPGSDVLVATGFGKWGMANGTAAGMLIADVVAGRERDHPWMAAFDATRIRAVFSRSFVKENVDAVVGRMVGDRVKSLDPPPVSSLAPGEWGIVDVGGHRRAAAFRDADGVLHVVSSACTHLGCVVSFNVAERTWDCPCHGSRYALDGAVIQGPAVRDVERLSLPPDDDA